eukprot:754519-Hanusia_phi.AAC.1
MDMLLAFPDSSCARLSPRKARLDIFEFPLSGHSGLPMTPSSVVSSASTVVRNQSEDDDVSECQVIKVCRQASQLSQTHLSCRLIFRVWMLLVRKKRSCQDRLEFIERQRMRAMRARSFCQWMRLSLAKTRRRNMVRKAARIHRHKMLKKALAKIAANLAQDKQSLALQEEKKKHSKEIERLHSLVSRHLKLAKSQEELIQSLQHRIESSDREFLHFMREKNQEIVQLQSKSCADTENIRSLQKKMLEESLKFRSLSSTGTLADVAPLTQSNSPMGRQEQSKLKQEQCEIDLSNSRERLERLLRRR